MTPLAHVRQARATYRRRVRTAKTVGRVTVGTVKVAGRAAYHPLKTLRLVVVCVLMLIWLTPYTLGNALRDGRKVGGMILPSEYACGPTEQEATGATKLASDLGHAVHFITTAPPPTATQVHDAVVGFGHRAGELVAVFRNSADGAPTPTEQVAAAEQVAVSCCSSTVPTGLSTDAPSVTAARAAIRAGFPDPVTAVAIAGAESGWVPTAANPASSARGEWQVMMSLHADLFGTDPWTDVEANARQAVAEAQGVQGPTVPLAEPAADPLVPPAQCTPSQVLPAGMHGSPQVEQAISYALAQRGKAYRWGSAPMPTPTGPVPATFDCSSLVDSAYLAAGIDIPGRATTATLASYGTSVDPAHIQRGDLVLVNSGHVGLALGDGRMVEAPHAGAVVRVVAYGTPWRVRRVPQAASATSAA